MFSTSKNNLLFFYEDINRLEINNKNENINNLNTILNTLAKKLAQKNIKLIVLPCPDKFDYYYNQIIEKNRYPRPIFFDYLRTLKKDYIYIDSKKILQEKTKNLKDVYFYDDTHWSPIAAKIIANEIQKEISIVNKKNLIN